MLDTEALLIYHRRNTQWHVNNRGNAAGCGTLRAMPPVLTVILRGRIPHMDMGIYHAGHQNLTGYINLLIF